MSVRKDVDELVAWYEAHSPAVHLIAVNATANTLRKFCKRRCRGGPLEYRNHVIEPVRKSRAERKREQAAEECRQLDVISRLAR